MNEERGYPPELLEAAEALTRLVAAAGTFDATMNRLAVLAVHAIDGADECSVSISRGGEVLRTVAATSEIGRKIDELQTETGEGPCKSSIEHHATVQIPDMESDDTWLAFSRRAVAETGVRSMLSYVLRLSDDETGVLNMLSRRKDAFSEADVETGTLFAAQAAVAVADALGRLHDQEKIAQLEEGMRTRQMIGQAVGILMSSRQVPADEAFEVLRNASQHSNIKIREIAQRLVDKTGDV